MLKVRQEVEEEDLDLAVEATLILFFVRYKKVEEVGHLNVRFDS